MTATCEPKRGSKAFAPRLCMHCHEKKAAEEFDMGPSGKRRLARCRECVARVEVEREQRAAARRVTWRDPVSGEMVRRCGRCKVVKPLDESEFAWEDKAHTRHQHWCRPCSTEARSERHKARMEADPEYAARWRENQRVQKLEWGRRNPEKRRAMQERYREAVKADPVRARHQRERQRMEYRLRAERAGRDVSKMRRAKTTRTVEEEQGGHLPAGPLVAAIEARVERLALSTEEVCADLGIHARMFTAWRSGERDYVQMDVADRVMQRLHVLWFDLVDAVEDPEAYARYEELFG